MKFLSRQIQPRFIFAELVSRRIAEISICRACFSSNSRDIYLPRLFANIYLQHFFFLYCIKIIAL